MPMAVSVLYCSGLGLALYARVRRDSEHRDHTCRHRFVLVAYQRPRLPRAERSCRGCFSASTLNFCQFVAHSLSFCDSAFPFAEVS